MRLMMVLVAMALGARGVHAEQPRWEVILDASAGEAWDAFTTQEGMQAWIAPRVEIDFRVGGLMRSNYDPEASSDANSWIETRILAFEPQRVLCWQTAKSPEGFEHGPVIEQAWSVIRFEPIGPERTRVVLTTCGWGEGEQWDAALEYFNAGNAFLLEKLETHFASESEVDPLDVLGRMVGESWLHESEPGGQMFRVRNTLSQGPGGACILMQGEQIIDGVMGPYASTMAWHDLVDDTCRFISVKYDGSVSRGTVRAIDENTIEWEWRAVDPAGRVYPFVIRTSLEGEGSYDMTVAVREENGGTREIGPVIDFRRVSD